MCAFEREYLTARERPYAESVKAIRLHVTMYSLQVHEMTALRLRRYGAETLLAIACSERGGFG